jgi:hypothetical protein
VVARVHHDALCAHAGAGHHRSVTVRRRRS